MRASQLGLCSQLTYSGKSAAKLEEDQLPSPSITFQLWHLLVGYHAQRPPPGIAAARHLPIPPSAHCEWYEPNPVFPAVKWIDTVPPPSAPSLLVGVPLSVYSYPGNDAPCSVLGVPLSS